MGTEQHIVELLYRRIRGSLTEREEAELQAWAARDPSYDQLLKTTMDDAMLEAKLKAYNLVPDCHIQDDPVLWAEIRRSQRSRWWRVYGWSAMAAAVLLVAAFAFFFPDRDTNKNTMLTGSVDIAPGGYRAVLTLADGRSLDLDSAKAGIIVDDEGLTYNDGSAVSPEQKNSIGRDQGRASSEKMSYLQLTTPKGGMYQVTLHDGTKVWLNAASTLKYPSEFDGERREVELSGEGYFEVSRMDDRPFVVRSSRQEIMVLGTSFNVNAYADDAETVTTLVSGSVRVRSSVPSDNTGGQLLKPSEQATLAADGALSKKSVNVSGALAWKQGRFSFDNKSFLRVMDELARWYNIEIVYETKIPSIEFFGDAVRNDNLSTILRLLESAKVTYRLEGRRLIITGK